MAVQAIGASRLDILHQLHALDAAGFDGSEAAAYVEQRGALLATLADIDTPWTAQEREALQRVFDTGARAWQRMVEQRSQLVARLQSVQQRRRLAEVAAPASYAARPRRTC